MGVEQDEKTLVGSNTRCNVAACASRCIGGEGECEHEWEWWASDTHHWQKCEKCNESKDEAPHNMSFDDTKNLYVCSVCGHECDHEHDFSGDWVKDGVDHWHVCKHKDCDAIDGYKRHTMVSDGEGYKCSECGYTRNHEKHQFDKYGFNGSGHWRKCSVKGCGVEDPDSYEEHSFEEDAENGYRCSICGFRTDHTEHSWGEWVTYHDTHWRYCDIEGCDAYQGGEHQWEDVDGTFKCKVCGAEADHKPPHVMEDDWKPMDDVRHFKMCIHNDWYDWEEHKWGDPDEGKDPNECQVCGYRKHDGEHEWSDWKPGIYVHWKECKIEGCLSTYEEEHQFDADGTCECGYMEHEHVLGKPQQFTDNNKEWHYRPCTYTNGDFKCFARKNEKHEFVNGVCECGYIIHEAKGDWKYDEYVHWHECKFDGCTDKLGENEHDRVNGVCRVCGYGKIDYPVYDDVQPVVSAPLPPQTGDASYLAIGIGMIAAALCIALRKRQSN